ncbi:ribonuclease H-like domain-containing protein [Tanacetum coccineum]
MDTGTTSHLADNTSILTFFSNSSIYPSVFVGNDYQTRRLFLRYDSTGDLYPVTQQPPFQNPVSFLSSSSTTWHRRLGHLGEDVLRRKHVKLPFYNSKSSVEFAFEIIHSDLWTSPILTEKLVTQTTIPADNQPQTISSHPMVIRVKAGIFKPLERMNCHVTTTSRLLRSHVHALRDSNLKEAMLDEYNALITNGTWVLVPRPANVNVVRSMWIFKHKIQQKMRHGNDGMQTRSI